MEPENTPLEKENHLPNHHFQVRIRQSGSMFNFRGVNGMVHPSWTLFEPNLFQEVSHALALHRGVAAVSRGAGETNA